MAYEPLHQPTVTCKLKHAETNHSAMSGGKSRKESGAYHTVWLIFIFSLKIGNAQNPFKPKQFTNQAKCSISSTFIFWWLSCFSYEL